MLFANTLGGEELLDLRAALFLVDDGGGGDMDGEPAPPDAAADMTDAPPSEAPAPAAPEEEVDEATGEKKKKTD